MTTLNDYLKEQMKDPEFIKAYEEVKPEIDAIRNSKRHDNDTGVFIKEVNNDNQEM